MLSTRRRLTRSGCRNLIGVKVRVLASRAGLRFNTLAHQIGTLDQPDQVAATIRQVVDSLPVPATLPPAEIEGFRRLDTVAEIRELAKN